jgi:hypothetical protein
MYRKSAIALVILNGAKRSEESHCYTEILRRETAQNDQCAARFLYMSEVDSSDWVI